MGQRLHKKKCPKTGRTENSQVIKDVVGARERLLGDNKFKQKGFIGVGNTDPKTKKKTKTKVSLKTKVPNTIVELGRQREKLLEARRIVADTNEAEMERERIMGDAQRAFPQGITASHAMRLLVEARPDIDWSGLDQILTEKEDEIRKDIAKKRKEQAKRFGDMCRTFPNEDRTTLGFEMMAQIEEEEKAKRFGDICRANPKGITLADAMRQLEEEE